MENETIRILSVSEVAYKSDFSHYNGDEHTEDDLKISLSVDFDDDELITGKGDELGVIFSVVLAFKDKDKDKGEFFKVLQYSVLNKFKLNNDIGKIRIENGEIKYIGKKLLRLILNTSVGSLRGMLVNKVSNLPINFIIPLVDVEGAINFINKK